MAFRMPKSWSLAALVVGLMLSACGGGVTIDPGSLKPVPPASMFVEHLAPFCGHDMPDKFTAGYFGSNPLDTTIYFYIVCHKGDTVYRDQWPGAMMASHDDTRPDSLRILSLQEALHTLVEGKLVPPLDSLDLSPAGKQPVFGYMLGEEPEKYIYYSLEDHSVHKL